MCSRTYPFSLGPSTPSISINSGIESSYSALHCLVPRQKVGPIQSCSGEVSSRFGLHPSLPFRVLGSQCARYEACRRRLIAFGADMLVHPRDSQTFKEHGLTK